MPSELHQPIPQGGWFKATRSPINRQKRPDRAERAKRFVQSLQLELLAVVSELRRQLPRRTK